MSYQAAPGRFVPKIRALRFGMFSKTDRAEPWAGPAASTYLAGGGPHTYRQCQRPKKNHNRIITGIGTPISQSKSPRPIFAS